MPLIAGVDCDGARLQIHDELLFLVRESHVREVGAVVRDAMQGASKADGLWCLSVPLPVKLQVGPSWGELQELKLD